MSDFVWSPERDADLRRMRGKGMRNGDIAEAMGTTLNIVYARVVTLQLPRLPVSGGANVKRGFWNEARDKLLRDMWGQDPQPTLRQIRAALDYAVSEAAISSRAIGTLYLPRRHRESSREKKLARVRSPFPGESPREAAETPKPRIVSMPDATPCPYCDPYALLGPDGKLQPCGVMVDRRLDRFGVRPSQYCAAHRPRIVPVSKGRFGTVSNAGSRRHMA